MRVLDVRIVVRFGGLYNENLALNYSLYKMHQPNVEKKNIFSIIYCQECIPEFKIAAKWRLGILYLCKHTFALKR